MVIKVVISDTLEEEVTRVRSIFLSETFLSVMFDNDTMRVYHTWRHVEVVRR